MDGFRRGSPSARRPPWIELPLDVTANILRRLGPKERLECAQLVCTTWWRVCDEPSRVIQMKSSENFVLCRKDETVCRLAVDRSRGELIDISIQHFGTDKLLQYISDRSSRLNRLRLDRCFSVSALGLMTVLKNLPLLEELHVIVAPLILAVDIEIISVSCPMLKSFSLHGYGNFVKKSRDIDGRFSHDIDDKFAVAIAKNMPNLRHLSLFQDTLSNVGLEAILKGCPNLESLDLRQCFHVDLECDLGRRCSEQIKELRCPLDSTADCDWFDQNTEYYADVDELGDREYWISVGLPCSM